MRSLLLLVCVAPCVHSQGFLRANNTSKIEQTSDKGVLKADGSKIFHNGDKKHGQDASMSTQSPQPKAESKVAAASPTAAVATASKPVNGNAVMSGQENVGTDDDSDASSATDAVDAEKVDRETRHDLEEEAAFLRNELSQFDGTVESDQDDSKKDDSALQDDVNKLQAELNTKETEAQNAEQDDAEDEPQDDAAAALPEDAVDTAELANASKVDEKEYLDHDGIYNDTTMLKNMVKDFLDKHVEAKNDPDVITVLLQTLRKHARRFGGTHSAAAVSSAADDSDTSSAAAASDADLEAAGENEEVEDLDDENADEAVDGTDVADEDGEESLEDEEQDDMEIDAQQDDQEMDDAGEDAAEDLMDDDAAVGMDI